MTKSPREMAARALCRKAGHAENTMFEGKPMWVSFLDDVDTVLDALRETPPSAWIYRWPINGQNTHWLSTTEQWLAEREAGKGAEVHSVFQLPMSKT